MTRIKIFEDKHAKKQFEIDSNALLVKYNTLFEMCSEYISIGDLTSFYNNPANFFLDAIELKYSKHYKGLKLDKICSLLDVPLQQIKTLANEVTTSEIKINPHKLEIENEPDFCLYAETEQEIERYNVANNLIKSYLQAIEFKTMYPALYCQGVNHILVPDYSSQGGIMVNHHFVKGTNDYRDRVY